MISHPALASELQMITTEVRAGKPRIEAFKNFAERTRVDDVRALVAMLVQTDRFGTSVAQALRTHAETSRTKRRQRAEERAAKIGVKLVFPLVFFLFPAFYVVTLGPAVIQFIRSILFQAPVSPSNERKATMSTLNLVLLVVAPFCSFSIIARRRARAPFRGLTRDRRVLLVQALGCGGRARLGSCL